MTDFIDLNSSGKALTLASADVCVVGAGAAGLFLADRLASRGRSVALLEAGDRVCADGASIGIEPVFSGRPYRGALEGRAFGWGGTTSLWGGVLVPHSRLDMREKRNPMDRVWGSIARTVQDHSPSVYSALGLGSQPDFFSYPSRALGKTALDLKKRGWETIAAEFLPFQRRNLTYLLARKADRRGKISVYLNTVASAWEFKPAGRGRGALVSIGALSTSGRRLRLSAKSHVITAGTIESARMLLEMDRSTQGRLFPRRAAIGRYLSDHLSCAIAQVEKPDLELAARIFGPRFARGRMRNFRFIPSHPPPGTPRHFTYFFFQNENPGFSLARKVLFGAQKGSGTRISLSEMAQGVAGLAALAGHRYLRSSLYIPPATPAFLQMDIEQVPDGKNRVSLGEKKDRYGRPVARVQWEIRERDLLAIRRVTAQSLQRWPGRAAGLPALKPLPPSVEGAKPYDIYHPVGTCRMGEDPEAVVGMDLRVRGTQNLFLLATGVLPSAGTANPTFSMLCLGDDLADRINGDLESHA
jgi:choline dehydrogenase-like flavoprotein